MRNFKPVLLISLLVFIALISCRETDNSIDGDIIDGDFENTEDELEVSACGMPDQFPLDEVDMQQKKFALTMFHFNVQYVAGGLEVEIDGKMEGFLGDISLGWTDERLQDWIITDTFEPVLDLYLAHPTWKATFEMQALMLEVIAERHPKILEKLQTGSQSGQIEMVSFHYSAQLFLAFPVRDLQKSVEITRKIFRDNCVLLSSVVFNQEGQAGEGKHAFMAENDYTISVFPKNLYRYVQGDDARMPYYKDRGVDVIIGPGSVDPKSGIEVVWPFFDDGEVLAFEADPYLAPLATREHIAKRIADYEAKLLAHEQNGFKITSISDYVNHLKAQKIEQPALPPVLDGTWQPTSTSSVMRWMGGRSIMGYNKLERDSLIRAENYRVSTELEAARIMLDTIKLNSTEAIDNDVIQMEAKLEEAFRDLYLAEVTDATGITPWIGEFKYARDANERAMTSATALISDALTMLDWPHATIDLKTQAATKLDDLPMFEAPEIATAPFEIQIDAPTRTHKIEWFEAGENTYELVATISKAEDETGAETDLSYITLDFPYTANKISYSPALLDNELVEYGFELFTFQKDEVFLPLANGLIGMGDDWWVIKECRQMHIAARIQTTEGNRKLQFIDETADPAGDNVWRFIVFKGSGEDALKLANKTNTEPVLLR